jgi:hypothetical protein
MWDRKLRRECGANHMCPFPVSVGCASPLLTSFFNCQANLVQIHQTVFDHQRFAVLLRLDLLFISKGVPSWSRLKEESDSRDLQMGRIRTKIEPGLPHRYLPDPLSCPCPRYTQHRVWDHGQRCQVHQENRQVQLFDRRL